MCSTRPLGPLRVLVVRRSSRRSSSSSACPCLSVHSWRAASPIPTGWLRRQSRSNQSLHQYSLRTGKLTGNFADSGGSLQIWLRLNHHLQWLAVKFPTQKNREFFKANRKIYPRITETTALEAISRHCRHRHHVLTQDDVRLREAFSPARGTCPQCTGPLAAPANIRASREDRPRERNSNQPFARVRAGHQPHPAGRNRCYACRGRRVANACRRAAMNPAPLGC
jgi:hypothetical protein